MSLRCQMVGLWISKTHHLIFAQNQMSFLFSFLLFSHSHLCMCVCQKFCKILIPPSHQVETNGQWSLQDDLVRLFYALGITSCQEVQALKLCPIPTAKLNTVVFKIEGWQSVDTMPHAGSFLWACIIPIIHAWGFQVAFWVLLMESRWHRWHPRPPNGLDLRPMGWWMMEASGATSHCTKMAWWS